MSDNPKLFLSYSWTSTSHQEWVLTFAQELSHQGIHVIFDKWDLKPGHDANAFMESMVTDTSVNKVLLICDAEYARKSDLRTGGAGTEAQIITPKLYTRRDQDKFAAAVREKNPDGSHCLPTYYQGRIFFDLTDDDNYALEIEKLVRWAWDKPVYLRPELGPKPAFLTDDASAIKLGTSLTFRRAQEAIKAGRDQAEAILSEYLEKFASEIEKFRITENDVATPLFDEIIVNNITEFTPYRNEFIELIISIAMYRPKIECATSVHRFFERIEPYCRRPSNVNSWRQNDFDNFKFIIHELFYMPSPFSLNLKNSPWPPTL